MAVDCAAPMWNSPIDFYPGGIDLPPLNSAAAFHGHSHAYGGDEMYGDLALLSGLSSPFGGFSIKRCQGFVRCDMDIDAEVVGWVIGKNGSTIKDLKNKTGCNMWVDQRALKLTITGPDARTVEHAAKSVEAYVAAAPIKAGAVEAAVTRSLDCPPHLLDILGDRATIARIVKETRAQVVVNKKMARAIIRGGPHAVQMACSKVQAIIAAAAAEHSYKAALDLERRALVASAAASDSGASDIGERDGVESVGSIGSRASSAVGSPACSAPASPRSGSGRSWSLFSGPSAFAAGAAVLSAQSSPHAMTAKGAASAAPTPESLFATFPASPAGDSSGGSSSSSGSAASSSSAAGAAAATAAQQLLSSKEDPPALSTVSEEMAAGASPPQQQQQQKQPKASASELHKLLAELQLTKYSSAFADNEVDMDAMHLMTEADFSEIGVPKGPRLKIMNAVKARKAASS